MAIFNHLLYSVLLGAVLIAAIVALIMYSRLALEWLRDEERGKFLVFFVLMMVLCGLLGHYTIRAIWP